MSVHSWLTPRPSYADSSLLRGCSMDTGLYKNKLQCVDSLPSCYNPLGNIISFQGNFGASGACLDWGVLSIYKLGSLH